MNRGTGMVLAEALAVVRSGRGERDVVVTTMGASREWMAAGPLHPLDFVLVPSSMGQATSFGLGLALACPDRRIIVCNGDGSMLMNLGSLVTIAAERPRNLLLLVGDNGSYEVTGAQPTPAVEAGTDLVAVARGCGLTGSFRYDALGAWQHDFAALLAADGPTFVALNVATVPGGVGPRSPGPAASRARHFMAALAAS